GPAPMEIGVVPSKQLPQGDWPLPVTPGPWHYRQSIEYEITNNRAILDLASRYKETFLFNIWRMGMNSIERGSRDNWTITPKRIEALKEAGAAGRGGRGAVAATGANGAAGGRGRGGRGAQPAAAPTPAVEAA